MSFAFWNSFYGTERIKTMAGGEVMLDHKQAQEVQQCDLVLKFHCGLGWALIPF